MRTGTRDEILEDVEECGFELPYRRGGDRVLDLLWCFAVALLDEELASEEAIADAGWDVDYFTVESDGEIFLSSVDDLREESAHPVFFDELSTLGSVQEGCSAAPFSCAALRPLYQPLSKHSPPV